MMDDQTVKAHRAFELGLIAMQLRGLPINITEVNPHAGTIVFTTEHGGNKYVLTLEPVDVLADNEIADLNTIMPSDFLG